MKNGIDWVRVTDAILAIIFCVIMCSSMLYAIIKVVKYFWYM